MTFAFGMAAMVLAWLQLAVVLCGLGLGASRLLGVREVSGRGLVVSFWVGLALSLLMLQLWHLVAPVGLSALLVLAALGSAGLGWNWRALWHLLRARAAADWWLGLVVLALALWLADLALGDVVNYDTGLYHLQAVQWAASYPLVTGLANLHSRFGFNSSFFGWAAMFGAGTWSRHVFGVASGFFYCALFTQMVFALRALRTEPSASRNQHLYLALMLAPTTAELFGRSIASLAPEGPVFVLTVVVAALLMRQLTDPPATVAETDRDLAALLLVAAAGCTIKLSFLVFGVSAGAIGVGSWLARRGVRSGASWTRLGLLATPAIISIVVWLVRGVLLSGYPLYPNRLGAIDVSWRVPEVFALEDLKWVTGWARFPDLHWSESLGNAALWLRHWLKFMPAELLSALQIAFVAVLVALLIGRGAIPRTDHLRRWLLLLPPVLAIGAWFTLAPDYRFASAAIWTLAATALLVLLSTLGQWLGRAQVAFEIAFCVVLFILISPFRQPLFATPHDRAEPFSAIPAVELKQIGLRSDVLVNVPTKGDQCWDAPLPCTPALRGLVQLRDGKDVAGGFMVAAAPGRPPGVASVAGLDTPAALGAWFIRSRLSKAGGWQSFDSAAQTIAFKGHVRIAIYSEHPTTVGVTLIATHIVRAGTTLPECALSATAPDGNTDQAMLRIDEPLSLTLPLAADINVVALEVPPDIERVVLRPIAISER